MKPELPEGDFGQGSLCLGFLIREIGTDLHSLHDRAAEDGRRHEDLRTVTGTTYSMNDCQPSKSTQQLKHKMYTLRLWSPNTEAALQGAWWIEALEADALGKLK